MTRTEGCKALVKALQRLERIDAADDVVLTLMKLRKNGRIYQEIVSLSFGTPNNDTELDHVIAVTRRELNGIMLMLNRLLVMHYLPFAGTLLRRRKAVILRQYGHATESMSYLISLIDPLLADEFDAACAA